MVIHFHINRTLNMRGADEVKYAEVISGNAGMTVIALLKGLGGVT